MNDALNYLPEYKFKPMPTPPIEVINYARRKLNDPKYELKPEFWRRADITSWRKQEEHVLATNKSNYEWLHTLKGENIGTPEQKAQIQAQIDEFDRHNWWVFGGDFLKEIASFSSIPEEDNP